MSGLRIFFSLLFPAFITSVQAQLENRYTDFLDKNILNAKAPKDKVVWLCTASCYYMEPDDKKSAALIDEAKLAAKADTRLTLMVLLLNAERLLRLGDYKYYINKSIEESKNALTVAVSNHIKDMQAGAYLYLAEGYNSSGELSKADSVIKIGLNIVRNTAEDNSFIYDSLTVECLVTQSRIQQAQRKLSQDYFDSSYKYFYNAHGYYKEKATETARTFFYIDYGVTSLYLSLVYKILNQEAKTEFTGYANSGNEATKRYDDSTFQTWGIKLIKDLALPAAWASGNRTAIRNAAYWLEEIYKYQEVATAYKYRKIYDSVNVLLRNDATEEAKAITSYEQTEADKERNGKEIRRRDNYQYLFITILVVFVFILLSILGFIRVPAIVIRLLGFFSFILLFEFIILIADSFIHNITHGEPWKVLAFKIVIAAILVPLHHYLEKNVINYLMQRQLLRSGSVVSGKK